jgi:hypothetical protein
LLSCRPPFAFAGIWTEFKGDRGTKSKPIPGPEIGNKVFEGGRELVTLRDAADYIMKLPKVEQNLEPWQTAVEALIMAAEDRGPLMHARIGMLRALNRNVERVFNSSRKDTHWGKRKLKRDERRRSSRIERDGE